MVDCSLCYTFGREKVRLTRDKVIRRGRTLVVVVRLAIPRCADDDLADRSPYEPHLLLLPTQWTPARPPAFCE